jgi:hypothetical protein
VPEVCDAGDVLERFSIGPAPYGGVILPDERVGGLWL